MSEFIHKRFLTSIIKQNNFNEKNYLENSNNLNLNKIVIWGKNLESGVNKGRITKILAKMYELPFYQKSVIIGLLLSDDHLAISSSKNKNRSNLNALLYFKQSLNKFDYLWFVFNILSHYCNSFPYLTIGKRNKTITYGLQIYTRALPCLTKLHTLFYDNKIKIIPEDIYNLLDPIALAHWIQGDGKLDKSGLTLCTDSYSIQDVVRLINVLIIRYDLKCSIHIPNKGQYRIYISKKSIPNLINLVLPYIVPSM